MEYSGVKAQSTFIIKILERRNSTWQGEVTWVEKNQTMHFRSALELLKLVDSSEDRQNWD
ncbi:MAG: hypothetical protein HFI06_02945 [Eubacterium sp.]|jgi:hypothetical protein|nr:hypothetical protein [Eubacterium sp.]NBI87159.1 hypothetical protein [Lachnospiraceae bacterium]